MRWSKQELDEISEKDFAIKVLDEQFKKVDPSSFKGIKLLKTMNWIGEV